MSTPALSSVSNTPYFGRAWKLNILNNDGATLTVQNRSYATESLKVTWTAELFANRTFATADISIYNLNQYTEQQLLSLGAWGFNEMIAQANIVSLYAGYQNNFQAANIPSTGPNGATGIDSLIWTGRVFQPLWERQNVTDFKVTLHCIMGYLEASQNYINSNIGPNATQAQIVRQIAKQARNPMSLYNQNSNIDNIDDLNQVAGNYPLGKVFFGRPDDYLDSIAKLNNLTYFLSPNGVAIRSLSPGNNPQPDFIFGPPLPPGVTVPDLPTARYTPTLIGTPQQTQQGVVFTVLQDSRVKLGSVVQLNMTAIRVQPQFPGTIPSILDQNNSYVVGGIKHTGDTRGESWYTEITGVSLNFWPLFLNGNGNNLPT